MTFLLDATLENDSSAVTILELCHVRLIRDAAYPWLILVPARADICDIDALEARDQDILMREISLASRILKTLYAPDKINVAALGNVVRQLHVHVVARFETDPAWPRPIWGAAAMIRNDTLHEKRQNALRHAFSSALEGA